VRIRKTDHTKIVATSSRHVDPEQFAAAHGWDFVRAESKPEYVGIVEIVWMLFAEIDSFVGEHYMVVPRRYCGESLGNEGGDTAKVKWVVRRSRPNREGPSLGVVVFEELALVVPERSQDLHSCSGIKAGLLNLLLRWLLRRRSGRVFGGALLVILKFKLEAPGKFDAFEDWTEPREKGDE
jgi:hypothetical protein